MEVKHETATFDGVRVSWSCTGDGPPLLLLHGFPQTRAMWDHMIPQLAETHTVIAPDLRGYGDSGKPKGAEHYSFRAMGQDLFALMDFLGHDRFSIASHDRGARVAHRMALDAPDRIKRLCLMDIIPTHTLLSEIRLDVAHAYYHWFFLAQPSPFPETLIGYDPDAYYQSCLLGWGGAALSDFDADQLDAYRAAWCDPDTIRAMCDDYRAALDQDFADDCADLDQFIHCPTLVLYGSDGAMAKSYDVAAVWSTKCKDLSAQAIVGGHFFPDTNPADTISTLRKFFAA